MKVYDMSAIYARIIGLWATDQTDLETVLKYELWPVPSSMFEDTGDMRTATAKSTLKAELQVEVSTRSAQETLASVIDGSAILWIIDWPANCLVEKITENMLDYLKNLLFRQDVYLFFEQRAKDWAYWLKLTLEMKLPAKDKVLTCTANKVQLIDIICDFIVQKVSDGGFNHIFVIIGSDDVPIQVSGGEKTPKYEYKTTHAEADLILVH